MKIKKIDIIDLFNICIIIFLIGLIANILLFKLEKETFMNELQNNDLQKKNLAKIVVNINKDNYKKYIKEKNKIIDNRFEIGYGKVPGVTEESLGFCPMGQYYSGKFNNNPMNVFSNCKDCFDCSKEGDGYYTKTGCMGDKDSICEYGRIPYNIYINIHQKPYSLHSQLPKHIHNYDYERKDSEYKTGKKLNEFNYKNTSNIHNHLF